MPAEYKVVIPPCNYTDLSFEEEVLGPVGAELVWIRSHNERELLAAYEDADAVLTQHVVVPRKHMEVMKKCKLIVRIGVGYDELDLDAATELGIRCANVPDYCMEEVSTHAMALALTMARKIFPADQHVRGGSWVSHQINPVFNLAEQTVGVIGLGRIGKAFVRKCHHLFDRVIASDPYIGQAVFEECGAASVSLEELLQQSDIVSLHIPLFKVPTSPYAPTVHLIGEKELRRMKSTAYLINTARGPVVDNEALYRALSEKWLAGAALDVMEREPPGCENPLLQLDNLVVTPHMAYYSESAVVRLRRQSAEEVKRVLLGGEPRNLLNPEVTRKT